MNADWINCSAELPRDGEQIEFVLDHRSMIMAGAYLHQSVRTRWAEYAIERVRRWRIRALDRDQATPQWNVPVSADLLGKQRSSAGGMAHAA